jgi:predicted Zn-dependent protease
MDQKILFLMIARLHFTLFLSGANALVDRKKLLYFWWFLQLHLIPYYYEDLDLGLNAWECGFKSYFDPQC